MDNLTTKIEATELFPFDQIKPDSDFGLILQSRNHLQPFQRNTREVVSIKLNEIISSPLANFRIINQYGVVFMVKFEPWIGVGETEEERRLKNIIGVQQSRINSLEERLRLAERTAIELQRRQQTRRIDPVAPIIALDIGSYWLELSKELSWMLMDWIPEYSLLDQRIWHTRISSIVNKMENYLDALSDNQILLDEKKCFIHWLKLAIMYPNWAYKIK